MIKVGDTAPFALQGGQYELAWTGEQCAAVAFELKQQDGDFDWKKESKVPRFSAIILGVPASTYSVTETDPSLRDLDRDPGADRGLDGPASAGTRNPNPTRPIDPPGTGRSKDDQTGP